MLQKLAIAAVVAAAVAVQVVVFQAVFAAPLVSAFEELRDAARAGTFEESILVTAERPAPKKHG